MEKQTGEMAQQLKALVALAEDLGLVPSTYMIVHVIHKLSFGNPVLSLESPGTRYAHGVCTSHAGKTHM